VLIGAAATEATVKAEMGKYQVLHLATHGVLDDRNPMYSHLVLAQTGNDEKEDGLLEARELLEMDLHAELAVLSACETGRGKIGAGEGMIGLTWALFVAGVPTTVVSQWKVADKSTADLMLAFHRNWQGGKLSKAAALRQASLTLLKTPATNHPFYWAGFVLVGAD
jgi:CHAT domain-containing protein